MLLLCLTVSSIQDCSSSLIRNIRYNMDADMVEIRPTWQNRVAIIKNINTYGIYWSLAELEIESKTVSVK